MCEIYQALPLLTLCFLRHSCRSGQFKIYGSGVVYCFLFNVQFTIKQIYVTIKQIYVSCSMRSCARYKLAALGGRKTSFPCRR
jgi:hypothetical protein